MRRPTAGKGSPVKATVHAAALRHGWSCEQVESNVYKYRKRGATITVAYTFGGHLNIQTVHIERGAEDWWMNNKTARKRQVVLEIMEDVR